MARKPRRKPHRRLERLLERLSGTARAGARPTMVTGSWILFLAAVVTGWVVGVPRMRASVAAATWTDAVVIDFVESPPWVTGDVLAMLEETARRQLTGDPFHQPDLRAARDALLNTGWFESIEQVRRMQPGHVVVEARFVKPFAVVRDGAGDHLVDPRGRLLPRSFEHAEAPQFVIIVGAHFDRPQRPGVQWDGADVAAALAVLRLIDSRPWRSQVTRIDVGVYLSRQMLILHTDRGSRVVWGSAPDEETAGEATAQRKLSYLDYQWEQLGHIDSGHPGELDITSPSGVFAR